MFSFFKNDRLDLNTPEGQREYMRRQEASKAPAAPSQPYKRDGGSRARNNSRRRPAGGGSPLASLGRYDDIPAALYPEGVSTGVGGGNAGQAQSIDPDGDAYIKPTETSPTRNVERNGAQGTQTSPGAAKPGDLNAFADLLGSKYGVQFRNGFESNHLPASGIGPVADGDEYGKYLNATKGTKGVGPFADGDTYARAVNGGHGEVAEGAQKGTSAVPDAGDQKRAVRVGRMDPRQRGGSQTGFNGADFSGAEPDDASLTSGISKRSRAFLDAPMGQGAMALRHAEAESGYIRQNGRNFAITGQGEDGKRTFQEFSDEGKNALQSDGNKRASQQFLKDYMMPTTDAKAAENPAVEAPVQVEPNTNMGPVADTEEYGKMLDATRGMTGMGPLANGEVYGAYLDGREPMMRDPRKK